MNGTIRAIALWRQKFDELSPHDQFKNLALLYCGAPYEWGHEIPLGTDCSGLICGSLIFMGHEVRITADQILHNLTSDKESDTELIFFIKNHKATHCGIVLGNGAMIHASGKRGVVIEAIDEVITEYADSGHGFTTAFLDFEKVKQNEGLAYDIDSELH